jgi:hypothetical protein
MNALVRLGYWISAVPVFILWSTVVIRFMQLGIDLGIAFNWLITLWMTAMTMWLIAEIPWVEKRRKGAPR